MAYRGPTTFVGATVEALRLELNRLGIAVADGILSAGVWTVVQVRADYTAHFGELLVVDTSQAAVTVTLPRATAADAGKEIAYARRDTTSTLTFVSPDAEINNTSTLTASLTVGRRTSLTWDGSEWWA